MHKSNYLTSSKNRGLRNTKWGKNYHPTRQIHSYSLKTTKMYTRPSLQHKTITILTLCTNTTKNPPTKGTTRSKTKKHSATTIEAMWGVLLTNEVRNSSSTSEEGPGTEGILLSIPAGNTWRQLQQRNQYLQRGNQRHRLSK